MPTEELFGAYHFMLEADGKSADDSFDFKAADEPEQVALLLPAVQSAREAARSSSSEGSTFDTDGRVIFMTDSIEAGDDEVDYGDWINVLTVTPTPPMSADAGGGLRSDGDLVQGVSEADMSGDFIL